TPPFDSDPRENQASHWTDGRQPWSSGFHVPLTSVSPRNPRPSMKRSKSPASVHSGLISQATSNDSFLARIFSMPRSTSSSVPSVSIFTSSILLSIPSGITMSSSLRVDVRVYSAPSLSRNEQIPQLNSGALDNFANPGRQESASE